jgi:hypothetical protein
MSDGEDESSVGDRIRELADTLIGGGDVIEPGRGPVLIPDALQEMSAAIRAVAFQLGELGKGQASDPRGAMEFVGTMLKEGLSDISIAISEGLEQIAEAIAKGKGE